MRLLGGPPGKRVCYRRGASLELQQLKTPGKNPARRESAALLMSRPRMLTGGRADTQGYYGLRAAERLGYAREH